MEIVRADPFGWFARHVTCDGARNRLTVIVNIWSSLRFSVDAFDRTGPFRKAGNVGGGRIMAAGNKVFPLTFGDHRRSSRMRSGKAVAGIKRDGFVLPDDNLCAISCLLTPW